jgi:hypothetical protein
MPRSEEKHLTHSGELIARLCRCIGEIGCLAFDP